MGGAEQFAVRLARHAALAGGYAVRVVCPSQSELAKRCHAAGIETTGGEFPGLAPRLLAQQLPAVARTRRLLSEVGEQAIVVANTSRTQAYVVAAATTVRRPPAIVHIAHEQDTAGRLTARLALARLGALVAVGANAAAAYRLAIPSVEVDQVNNFLTSGEITRLRNGPAPRHAGTVIGVIARMIPEKGILEFLHELAAANTSWANLLVAATPEDTDYEANVREQLDALGFDRRIQLLGHVKDVSGLLHAVDVLVVPSIGSEGQPTVILESLAAGVAVVVRRPLYSSDFEGLPVFSYSDAGDLATALNAAVNSPPASTAVLQQRFGPEQVLEGLERAAQRAISSRSR